ncbi:MAG: type II/IV secretion system ATPase subunit, partial [Candidatus Thermoplasmatota archaeon]
IGGKITEIKKYDEKKIEEVELKAIRENYSYVRILFNKETNEHLYEVIEPQMDEEEKRILEDIQETLEKTLEYRLEKTTAKDKEEYLRKSIDALILRRGINIEDLTKEKIVYYIIRNFVGYGPIDVMMIDPMIEDISCDGSKVPLYIFHRKYLSMKTNVIFNSDHELDSFVIALARRCGKHISAAEPLLDATMPDGSRLQATLAREVTARGSSFTIRRFRENPYTPCDLLKMKTLSEEIVAYLWLAIENGESMFIVGGTASGKTTTLNAILLFIPPQMKIVSIEDTREINLPHENWIAGVTRSGFGAKGSEGKSTGEIDMFDLMRAALRQRPHYLIVGEVRGKEAYTLFQAMATGKTVYSTIHADSVRSMVHRLESPPIELPRLLISSLGIVLLQGQVKVGEGMGRRVKSIVEIVGVEPDTNELITNTVYGWNPVEDKFIYSGHSYLFEKIRNAKNITIEQMNEELERRKDIIRYMVKINVKNYVEVARVVSSYYRNPDRTMEVVRKELGKI